MQDNTEKNIHNSEFSLRIKEIMNHYGLNQIKFSETIEVGKGRLSNILTGRNKPDVEFIALVAKKFTDVNSYWILTGEGDMLKSKKYFHQDSSIQKPQISPDASALIDEIKKLTVENYLLKEKIIELQKNQEHMLVSSNILVEK